MRKGICKHYNGFNRCPCNRHKSDCVACSSYKDPTDEELEADEKEWDIVFKKLKIGMPLFAKVKAENPNGGAGLINCPVCQGKFHYTISSYNNHMYAKCETEGCLTIME